MDLGRSVLRYCNAFRWEHCLSTINNSAEILNTRLAACVSCQMWKRRFSPCGDNEGTEAWEQAGKCMHACMCAPPCVCAGLEGQMPHETAFLSESLIKLLDWEQRLSPIPSFPDSPRKESHPLWWSKVVKKQDIKHSTNQRLLPRGNHMLTFWRFMKKNNTCAILRKNKSFKMRNAFFYMIQLRRDAPQ